jgi:non-canonical purine NTP pyrophosphatase (RdgB/HAM1 family)
MIPASASPPSTARRAAMARVHDQVGARDHEDRGAWFICCLCLAWPDGHAELFTGRVDGRMVWPPRGSLGFGYDPIFQPHGSDRTYGETDAAEKHATSHRARAFAELVAACLA